MQASRPFISRLLAQNVRKYHHGEFKPPTMDELPVPKGSWQAKYDKDQRKYNSILALGVAFSVFSVTLAKTSGLLFLNFSPPDTYE